METKDVYMTAEQVEELQAKVDAIEGVAEIRAAIRRSHEYHRAKQAFERGELDIEFVPKHDPDEQLNLSKKYPRADAFLIAESWAKSWTPIKARLGSKACQRILDGEDYTAVLEDMKRGMEAFNMAQEG